MNIELILIISLSVSLIINLILFIVLATRKKPIILTFDEIFCVLNTSIDNNKRKFNLGLQKLQKSYAILGFDGTSGPPNDKIKEYSEKKQDLKVLITKKIVRNLSTQVRERLLEYYSPQGLVHYISAELDKEDIITN